MKRAYCKYILALLLFGTNGIIASYVSLASYHIVLLRTLIGSLLLIVIFKLLNLPITFVNHKRQFIYLAISGIAMGASWMFLYEAYQKVGVSIASLIYYCGPVIVMVLSPVVFHEQPTVVNILGFIAVLCGLFLVNGKIIPTENSSWGVLCGGMSAIMYAFMVIFNKKAKHIVGLENAMLQLIFSFLTVAIFVGMKHGMSMDISGKEWLPILMLGLVNTGMGCYLYFSPLSKLPVQTVSILGYLEPLSALIFSAILLKEVLFPAQIVGAIVILGGAIFSECAKR